MRERVDAMKTITVLFVALLAGCPAGDGSPIDGGGVYEDAGALIQDPDGPWCCFHHGTGCECSIETVDTCDEAPHLPDFGVYAVYVADVEPGCTVTDSQ